MNLSTLRAIKDSVADIGRQLATEGLESGSKESDSFFECVVGLLMVKKALDKIINERTDFREEAADRELCRIFHSNYSTDSGPVSSGCGMDGGDAGTVHMPGKTQAHGTESPK